MAAKNWSGTYDVVVAGGGAAGVSAAVAAASAGTSVLLVERAPALGGAATQRNVAGYCGLYTCRPDPVQAVGGIASEVLRRLSERAGVSNREIATEHDLAVVYVDPEAVKVTLDEVAREAGVDMLVGATISAARRNRDEITSVTILDFGGRTTDTPNLFGAGRVMGGGLCVGASVRRCVGASVRRCESWARASQPVKQPAWPPPAGRPPASEGCSTRRAPNSAARRRSSPSPDLPPANSTLSRKATPCEP
jgi:FAD-dependent oxidoreductase family protein